MHLLAGLANGWQLSGYTAFQSGAPLQPNMGGFMNATDPGGLTVPTVQHPNLPDNSITMPNGLKAMILQPVGVVRHLRDQRHCASAHLQSDR